MIILIDQDETLADFIGGFSDKWSAKYPEKTAFPTGSYTSPRVLDHYPDEPKDLVESIYTSPGFIFGLNPIEGGIEAIKEMIAEGHDVRICTSPLSSYENCITEKYLWIEKYLGRDFTKKMIVTKDKTLIRGDILIDDSVPKGVITPSWKHIIFDRPHNRNIPGTRLERWSDWKEMIG